jgi:hypothetical protein
MGAIPPPHIIFLPGEPKTPMILPIQKNSQVWNTPRHRRNASGGPGRLVFAALRWIWIPVRKFAVAAHLL